MFGEKILESNLESVQKEPPVKKSILYFYKVLQYLVYIKNLICFYITYIFNFYFTNVDSSYEPT